MNRTDFFKNAIIYCEDTKETCIGYTAYAKSKHWRKTSAAKLKACPVCHICGKKKTSNRKIRFNAHHRNYKNLGHEIIEEDLVTLCEPCHKFIHKYKKDYPNLLDMPPEQIKQFKKMQQQMVKKKKIP